jgi:hypothetical protein
MIAGWSVSIETGQQEVSMSLEHRWSTRKQVCLEAIIFHRSLGLMPVRILDIGLEGAFITAERLDLPVPGIVELTFAIDIDGKKIIYHMNAMVMHHTRNGYGVMFREFKIEAFRTLMDVLYAA